MKLTDELSPAASALAGYLAERLAQARPKADRAVVAMSEREGMRITGAESPADLLLTVAELMRVTVDATVLDEDGRGVGWLLSPIVVGWRTRASDAGGLITVLVGEAAAALSIESEGPEWLSADRTGFGVTDTYLLDS